MELEDFTTFISIDLELTSEKKELINESFKLASQNELKGILSVEERPLVSSDFLKNPHSSIVDLELTNVIQNSLVKVVAWYDNEYGFVCRMCDVLNLL